MHAGTVAKGCFNPYTDSNGKVHQLHVGSTINYKPYITTELDTPVSIPLPGTRNFVLH